MAGKQDSPLRGILASLAFLLLGAGLAALGGFMLIDGGGRLREGLESRRNGGAELVGKLDYSQASRLISRTRSLGVTTGYRQTFYYPVYSGGVENYVVTGLDQAAMLERFGSGEAAFIGRIAESLPPSLGPVRGVSIDLDLVYDAKWLLASILGLLGSLVPLGIGALFALMGLRGLRPKGP